MWLHSPNKSAVAPLRFAIQKQPEGLEVTHRLGGGSPGALFDLSNTLSTACSHAEGGLPMSHSRVIQSGLQLHRAAHSLEEMASFLLDPEVSSDGSSSTFKT